MLFRSFVPCLTNAADKCAYSDVVGIPFILPWSMIITLPYPLYQPTKITRPAFVALTAVPEGAAISKPEWKIFLLKIGCILYPKYEEILP